MKSKLTLTRQSKGLVLSTAPLYWEARLENIPRVLEPAISVWLFEHGCAGTQEVLDFSQPNLRYLAKVKSHPFINLTAYFDLKQKELVEELLNRWIHDRSSESHVTWHRQKAQDWLKEWKKYFKTFRIAGLTVVPSWELKSDSKLNDKLVIEPGMAFGTGTHPTTRFALEMLQALSDLSQMKARTVLDVGAGSGILSVAAERFGAKSVVAIDNDPESWRECGKTFRLNRTKCCSVTEKQLGQTKIKYGCVIANIIDGVLMDLRKKLLGATAQGGHLILSGILADGATAFKRDFLHGQDAKIIKELSDGEWTSLLISK